MKQNIICHNGLCIDNQKGIIERMKSQVDESDISRQIELELLEEYLN